VVRLALGTAGDRTDDILRSLGRVAGRRADQVVIVHKQRYLRGRSAADMEQLMSAGLADVGVAGVPAFDDELAGLQALAAAAQPGDVVAVMCHADRPALDEWLTAHGATADGPPDVRRKVLAARGEHPHEALIRRLWSNGEPAERNQQLRQLLDADPSDPRLQFEWASAFDADGHEALAVPTYRAALDGGLREPHRTRALIQLASSLTVLGQAGEAVQLLDDVVRERPTSVAAQGFLALALRAGGRADDAFVVLLRALLQHASDPDDNAYAAALSRYAGGIATP
jgi:cyanophycin synthetase